MLVLQMHTPSAPTIRSRDTYNCDLSLSQDSNMPTKMAKFCREKGVLITVYEEKPRRRKKVSTSHQHHHQVHHHHHHHHYLHQTDSRGEVIQYKNSGSGKGYNRRAELLRYSQSLRESARPAAASSSASIPLLPKPLSPKHQQPTSKTITVHRWPSHARTPTCLGNWKILIPSFIRSLISPKAKKDRKKKKHSGSTTNKMKALMKSLEVQKKSRTFLPKLFSSLRKHR